MFVLAYGSLMDQRSLELSLAGVRRRDCLPVVCHGYRRAFGVAFPNDGSQRDKAYFDEQGRRPPIVLFCDIQESSSEAPANGVCIPVDMEELEALKRRELRYRVADVTDRVSPYGDPGRVTIDRVWAFTGRPEFTNPDRVALGVVPRAYMDSCVAGAMSWEHEVPGFTRAFYESTDLPAPDRVLELRRMDFVRSSD